VSRTDFVPNQRCSGPGPAGGTGSLFWVPPEVFYQCSGLVGRRRWWQATSGTQPTKTKEGFEFNQRRI
jgi:hypothetical protein